MHFTDIDQFRFISIRQMDTARRRGEEHIDERIRPIMRALNNCSATTTVWSCSGHTTEEQIISHPGERPLSVDRAYIVFVLGGDKGSYVLETISEWIKLIHSDHKYWVKPQLMMTTLKWFGISTLFDKKDVGHIKADSYNCWCLEMKCKASVAGTNEVREVFNILADMLNTATAEINHEESMPA